jgi:hypothetical protein
MAKFGRKRGNTLVKFRAKREVGNTWR